MPRTYTCRRCGGQGHNRATCSRSPETDGTYERARPLLGTMPDSEVADRVGISTQTVTTWRRRLGIPKVPRRPNPEIKYPGITARLGVDPDVAVAADYGLSRERVRQIRQVLHIGRAGPKPLDPKVYAMLGWVPDSHISDATNIPSWIIRRERVRAGIPPVNVQIHYDDVISRVHEQVGQVSDRTVAEILGVAVTRVAAYRRRHGIPPFVRSPKCSDFVPLDREAVARMFHSGSTDNEIAIELDTTPATIRQIRYQIGLIRRTRRNQGDK